MPEWLPYQKDQRKVMFFGDKPELLELEESDVFQYLQKCCEEGKVSHLKLNGFARDL